MQRFYNFIVVFFLLASNWLPAKAQNSLKRPVFTTNSINGKVITATLLQPNRTLVAYPHQSYTIPGAIPVYHRLSPDYYVKTLGFVCRAEYKMEKKLKLPLAPRLRVGSLDYVNRMEGKR